MRQLLVFAFLGAAPLAACPNAAKAAEAYAHENFGGDEDNPVEFQKKVMRVNPQVSAVQFTLPPETDESSPRISTAFFTGNNCELAEQWPGEITDSIEIAETKYLFIKHEEGDEDNRQVQFQVVTVKRLGEVSATHDQHGSELQFTQAVQTRCEGKVGEFTTWQRDTNDSLLVVVRERQSDRDEKCRMIQDASTFRYYRLTEENWRLDDGDTEAEPTTTAKRRP
jgi:hypothetical protein